MVVMVLLLFLCGVFVACDFFGAVGRCRDS
jgi:hypothetical protein